MISISTILESESFDTILKLPFVKSIIISRLSKTHKRKVFRGKVLLTSLFKTETLKSIENQANLVSEKRDRQQWEDAKREIEQTQKIKSKNYLNYVRIAEKYNLMVPNKKQNLEYIKIIKSLSIK